MWSSYAGSRSWSCEQCRESPSLRRRRGSCGGEFQDGLPWLKRDEEGAYIMAYRIAPDCDPSWGEQRVRRCPIADANRLAPLAQTYQAHRAGLGSLWDFYKTPSCAVVEYWTELHHQTELMRARARERAAEEARHHG